LIRLAPLIAVSTEAQAALVAIGLCSAVIASLVMTTRVSVKVALAWSTCAQMGFMLVQCGLGLWHLALLHIVAHSLYKAHAFLTAGDTVDRWRERALHEASPASGPARLRLGVALAGAAVATGIAAWGEEVAPSLLIIGLSLAPTVARPLVDVAAGAALAARVIGLVALYGLWHAAAAWLVPAPPPSSDPLVWALAGAGLLTLFAVQTALRVGPRGPVARALYPALFAGLYLDERVSRLSLRLWPLRPASPSPE